MHIYIFAILYNIVFVFSYQIVKKECGVIIKFVYLIHEKLFRFLWKVEDLILLYVMKNDKYKFEVVNSGAGLLHKYIMINKYNNKKYFIKKPTILTDIWQYSQRKFNNTIGIYSEYTSLTGINICNIISEFISIKELKELSLVILVSKRKTIVYKFIDIVVSSSDHLENNKLLNIIRDNGFKFLDSHDDNFLLLNNKLKIIDLESLIYINTSKDID